MKKNLRDFPNITTVAGIIILLYGAYYEIIKAGIPYQDPPVELYIQYTLNMMAGGILCRTGLLVILTGILYPVIRNLLVRIKLVRIRETEKENGIIDVLLYGLLMAGLIVLLLGTYYTSPALYQLNFSSYVELADLLMKNTWEKIQIIAAAMVVIGAAGLISKRFLNKKKENEGMQTVEGEE